MTRTELWILFAGLIAVAVCAAMLRFAAPIEGFSVAANAAPYWGPWGQNGIMPTFPMIAGGRAVAREGMTDRGTPDTSHTVNLPLTTTVECRNKCMVGRCSGTGQQCVADVDCPGCNTYRGGPFDPRAPSVKGNNDAGKLTAGMTPRYSTLTTDMGTMAHVYDAAASPNWVGGGDGAPKPSNY